LKSIDYVMHVKGWWQERNAKPRGLVDIVHHHPNLLPITRAVSDLVSVPTMIAQLAGFLMQKYGDAPLIMNCAFGGDPLPFVQIGQEREIKIELSMTAFDELMQGGNAVLFGAYNQPVG
jgi:hypothetical protein